MVWYWWHMQHIYDKKNMGMCIAHNYCIIKNDNLLSNINVAYDQTKNKQQWGIKSLCKSSCSILKYLSTRISTLLTCILVSQRTYAEWGLCIKVQTSSGEQPLEDSKSIHWKGVRGWIIWSCHGHLLTRKYSLLGLDHPEWLKHPFSFQ